MKTTLKQPSGFTLIEILIALFIFAVIAAITTTVLRTIINTRDGINKSMHEMAELQIAIALLDQDLHQVVQRKIQLDLVEPEPAFVGTFDGIAFTHGGLVNPMMQLPRSTLQRVGYQYRDGSLYRIVSSMLDSTNKNSKKILTHVENIQFSFIGENKTSYSIWPKSDNSISLPRAVRMTIKLKKQAEINLLFPVTECTVKQNEIL